tara:strand:- start:690 stop:845 length:156 start_codon:yes stop_codon:yes gene_type:complete
MALAGMVKGAGASKAVSTPPEVGITIAHGIVRKRPSTTKAWRVVFDINVDF